MKYLPFLLALSCFAQFPIEIDAGAPGETACSGFIWQPGVAGYIELGAAPWHTLRYNSAFTCAATVPNGAYVIELGLMEPNKTGPGQRIFTVSANRAFVTAPLDLFQIAGLRQQFRLVLPVVVVEEGSIRLDFKATLGNAVVSYIRIRPLASTDLAMDFPPLTFEVLDNTLTVRGESLACSVTTRSLTGLLYVGWIRGALVADAGIFRDGVYENTEESVSLAGDCRAEDSTEPGRIAIQRMAWFGSWGMPSFPAPLNGVPIDSPLLSYGLDCNGFSYAMTARGTFAVVPALPCL